MNKRISSLGLFGKISCVVVAGAVVIAAFTLFSALRTTERSYVETLSAANTQTLREIEADMASENDVITALLMCAGSSSAFRDYLTSNGENPAAFRQVYAMRGELDAIAPGGFYDMAVVSASGHLRYVTNGTDLCLTPAALLASGLTQAALADPHRILYRFLDAGITNRSKDGGALAAVRALTYPGSDEIYGFAYIVLRQEDLRAFYARASTPVNTVMLCDGAGRVVSAAAGAAAPAGLAAVLDAMADEGTDLRPARLGGGRVTVQTCAMPQWGLRLVAVLDQHQALREMGGRTEIVLVCLLVCALVLAVVSLFIRQVTRPINDLAEKMQTVTEHGLTDRHVEIKGGYEARRLGEAFNHMLDDMGRYVDRLVSLEQEKRGLELTALQAQIKPHFIYNTLTSIKWLIWQQENDRAAQCIDAFSLLLRATIGDRKEQHTAAEEMETLRHYIFLQQIRYGPRIRADVLLSPAAEGVFMPKLLLQPIVENAFFHAFTDRAQGSVAVCADLRGNDLVCEVIDDGVGMTPEQAESVLRGGVSAGGGSGIGVANVDARVRLLFGPRYGVQIFTAPGGGATVRVTLPACLPEKITKNQT